MKTFIQSILYLSVGVGSLFFVIWILTSFPFFQSVAQAEESVGEAPVTPPSPQGSAPVEQKGTASPSVTKMNQADAVEKKLPTNSKKEVPSTEAPVTRSAGPVDKPVNKKEGGRLPVSGEDAVQPSAPNAIDSKEATINSPVEKNVPVQRSGASVPDNSSVVSPPPTLAPDKEGVVPPPPPDAVNNDTGQTQPDMEKKEGEAAAVSEQESAEAAHTSNLNQLLESAQGFQKQKGAGADAANKLMDIEHKRMEVYKALSHYQYNSEERRDPFVPPKMEGIEDVELAVPTYPTGKYDLSEIKLKGIKWDSKAGPSKALFETPDKVIHYLQKNDWIGKNRGVIYQLKEDEVVVVEPRLRGSADDKKEDSYVPVIVRLDRLTNDKKGK